MKTYQSGSYRQGMGRQINVGKNERKASMMSGAALAVSGLKKLAHGRYLPGMAMLAAGGMVFYRGKSGHCNVYQAMGINTARVEESGVQLEKVVTINRSPQQVYDFWHNLTNLPRFMRHLESVEVTGANTSHWKAKAMGGLSLEWDAETVQDLPGQLIGWRSIGDATVPNEGTVRFVQAPGNRGTELSVSINYYPPGGAVGQAAAKFLQTVNARQLEEDLKRLKQIIETGETATALAI